LASNGSLDWSSPKRLGKCVHKPGERKTHWEFLHNRVGSNDQSMYELMAVDTHPGMDGSFVVESNLFENLRHGIGIRGGSGIIRGNLFRNLRGKPFRPFVAISIAYGAGERRGHRASPRRCRQLVPQGGQPRPSDELIPPSATGTAAAEAETRPMREPIPIPSR
jgi:hypothetical protein